MKWLLTVLIFGLSSSLAWAEEEESLTILLRDGECLSDAAIKLADDEGLLVLHSEGLTRVSWGELPDDSVEVYEKIFKVRTSYYRKLASELLPYRKNYLRELERLKYRYDSSGATLESLIVQDEMDLIINRIKEGADPEAYALAQAATAQEEAVVKKKGIHS